MGDEGRQIRVKLGGPAIKHGRVSLKLLTTTLDRIQQSLLQIGKAKHEYDPSTPGPAPSRIRREYELFLLGTKPNFEARLVLPPKEASLFPDHADLAEESLVDLDKIVEDVLSGNRQDLEKTIPSREYRERVVWLVTQIMPREGADYDVSLAIGKAPHERVLRKPEPAALKKLLRSEEAAPVGASHEALIDALCRAEFGPNGKYKKVTEMIEYEFVEQAELWTYRPEELEWKGRKFLLRHQIACGVSSERGFYLIEYEPLRILVYAREREGAIAEFRQEFAMLWDVYADAPDDKLTGDAIELKRHLRHIVREAITA